MEGRRDEFLIRAPENGFNRVTQALTILGMTNPGSLEVDLIFGNAKMSLGTVCEGLGQNWSDISVEQGPARVAMAQCELKGLLEAVSSRQPVTG